MREGDEMSDLEMKIGVVPTAGAITYAYWFGRKMPFWSCWPILKWFCKLSGMEFRYIPELKEETRCRLDRVVELFLSGNVDYILLVGGWSKKRDPSVFELSKRYLIAKSIPEEKIFGGSNSLDSDSHAREARQCLGKYPASLPVAVNLVTSHYHMFRAKRTLEREGVVVSECYPVHPSRAGECWRNEYGFNLYTEWLKIVMTEMSFVWKVCIRMETWSRS